MARFELALPFKGARNYLHGSDIFNALSRLAPDVSGDNAAYVDHIKFARVIFHACALDTKEPADRNAVVGYVGFQSATGERTKAWLMDTKTTVTQRVSFDEAAVTVQVILDQEAQSATMGHQVAKTPIENIIVATKALNYSLSEPRAGQWLFGQLDLAAPLPDSYTNLRIKMTKMILGQFSVSEISLDERNIGKIQFIAGQV